MKKNILKNNKDHDKDNDNDNHKTTIYTNNNNDNNDDIVVSFAVPALSSAVVPKPCSRPSGLGSRESQRCYRLSLGPEEPDENGKGCKDQF